MHGVVGKINNGLIPKKDSRCWVYKMFALLLFFMECFQEGVRIGNYDHMFGICLLKGMCLPSAVKRNGTCFKDSRVERWDMFSAGCIFSFWEVMRERT